MYRYGSRYIVLGIILLVLGLVWLVRILVTKRRMRVYGVDEAAMQQYEKELHGNRACVFGKVAITDNWVSHRTVTGTVLFPLKEIVFFKKGGSSGHYHTSFRWLSGYQTPSSFHVKLLFTDGHQYTLPCTFEQQDTLMAVLEERCPQANTRDFGTYL